MKAPDIGDESKCSSDNSEARNMLEYGENKSNTEDFDNVKINSPSISTAASTRIKKKKDSNPLTVCDTPNQDVKNSGMNAQYEALAAQKQTIVLEMARKIGPFVDHGTGKIKAQADFASLASLMENETHFVQRSLILAVILTVPTTDSETLTAMAESELFLGATSSWLKSLMTDLNIGKTVNAGLKKDVPIPGTQTLLGKIVEILARMTPYLKIEQLVTHKFGRALKKISANKECPESLRSASTLLCERWSLLLAKTSNHSVENSDSALEKDLLTSRSGDKVSRASNISSNAATGSETLSKTFSTNNNSNDFKSRVLTEEKLKNMPTIRKKEPKSTIASKNEDSLIPLKTDLSYTPVKSRAQLILDRAAERNVTDGTFGEVEEPNEKTSVLQTVLSSSAGLDLGTRPMSADDIRKEKRRKQYLAEATARKEIISIPSHLEFVSNDNESTKSMAKSSVKVVSRKCVTFAPDDQLVSIRLIDSIDYDAVQSDEESVKIEKPQKTIECTVEWKTRRLVESSSHSTNPPRGLKSVEREVQAHREKRTLSVNYFLPIDIPPSPSVTLVSDTHFGENKNYHQTKAPSPSFPWSDPTGRLITVTRYVPSPREASRFSENIIEQSPSIQPSPHLTDEMLQSLLSNPSALQSIIQITNGISNLASHAPPINEFSGREDAFKMNNEQFNIRKDSLDLINRQSTRQQFDGQHIHSNVYSDHVPVENQFRPNHARNFDNFPTSLEHENNPRKREQAPNFFQRPPGRPKGRPHFQQDETNFVSSYSSTDLNESMSRLYRNDRPSRPPGNSQPSQTLIPRGGPAPAFGNQKYDDSNFRPQFNNDFNRRNLNMRPGDHALNGFSNNRNNLRYANDAHYQRKELMGRAANPAGYRPVFSDNRSEGRNTDAMEPHPTKDDARASFKGKKKTVLCAYYKANQPKSCRNGINCTFLHLDI